MLVFPIWLSQGARAWMVEAVKGLQLLIIIVACILGAIAVRANQDVQKLSQVFGGPYHTTFPLINTVILSVHFVAGAIAEVIGSYDLSTPNQSSAGTLRLTNIAHKYVLMIYVTYALSYGIAFHLKLASAPDGLKYNTQRIMREYALEVAEDDAIREINFMQQRYKCCGIKEKYTDNSGPLEPGRLEGRPRSINIWLRGVWVEGRDWDVPWSCCNASQGTFCHHKTLGFSTNGSSDKEDSLDRTVDGTTIRDRINTIYMDSCDETVMAEIRTYYTIFSLLCFALALLMSVSGVLSRYVKTSLWGAVWWSLDYERSSPGFLCQIDLLRSRKQRPAFEIAAISAKTQRQKQKLREQNLAAAEITMDN